MNNKNNEAFTLPIASKVFSIIGGLLGFTVLIAWNFNHSLIIQLHTSLAPMHFNEALCIFLSGISLFFINHKLKILFPSIVLFISFITLLEYILSINLGLDQLFISQKSNLFNLLPGRMSPIAAICLFLIAACFITFISSKVNSGQTVIICNICSFYIIALLTISLFGYTLNINSFYSWGYFSPMTIHSALALMCISISTKIFINSQYQIDNIGSFFSIYLFSILFMLFWLESANEEYRKIEAKIQTEISLIENSTNQMLNTHLVQLKNIKTDENNTPINPVDIIYKTPWLNNIQWFDINSASQVYSFPNIEIKNNFTDDMLNLFKEIEQKKVFSANTINKGDIQNSELIIINPSIKVNEKITGFIISNINIKVLFENLLLINNDFISIKLSHNDQVFFDSSLPIEVKKNQFTTTQKISIHGMTWALELTPKVGFLNDITTSLPSWLLFIAIMFTFLYSFIFYYFELFQIKVNQLIKNNKQIQDEKTKLNALTNNLNDAIIIINKKSIIQSFSKKSVTLFGYTEKEVIGRNVNLLMPIELNLQHDKHIKGFTNNKKNKASAQKRNLTGIHKNQKKFPIEINLVEVVIDQEHQFISVIKDLSFENKTLEQLEKSRFETESIKIAKSKFIEYMGHQIKSPMNSIYGVLQLLDHESNSDKNNKLIEQALFYSKSLIYTIDDIIDFSKIQGDQLVIEESVFSIKQLIQTLVHDMEHEAQQKDVKLTVSYSSNFTDGWLGDPVRIRQIILNLILNSLKYTVDGSIDIHVDIIDSNTHQKSIKITVTDTGSGMTKEKAASLFNHIDQGIRLTTHLCDGLGIDLLIVEKIVQLMDGAISVSSSEGEGSCFLVILPLIKQNKNFQEMHLHTKGVVPHFESKHILLVESDAVSKVVLKSMLEATKADISVVSNGKQAIDYLKNKQPDLIMINTYLPVLNGIEACREIRDSNFIMPIIALSEHKIQDDIKNYQQLGFNARIDKPIELHHLYQILTEQFK